MLFSVSGISLALLNSCNNKQQSKNPPNVILIIADDLGYNELGCYGQEIIKTPFIDRLAEEGIRFTCHYSGSPVCAPSRCVLLTGKHTGHSYIRNNFEVKGGDGFQGQKPIPDSVLTIAEILKDRGYATGAVGKWGLGKVGSEGDPNKQGFDLFFGFNCQRHAHNHYPRFLLRNQDTIRLEGNNRELYGEQYSQDLFIDEALQFISGNKNTPFFLYLPFTIPHLSIQVPEESLKEYIGVIPEEQYIHRSYLQHPNPRAGYAAMITHMDKGIGRILDHLKELGIDKNTLVIFTSDNGPAYDRLGGSDSEFFKSAGEFKGLKGSVYEGGIRVPFIARWPGMINPGMVSDHISAFQDILPTLAEITGAIPPQDTDGISFLPTLSGQENQEQHDYLYMEFPSYGGQQMVRMGEWKGVRQYIFRDSMNVELYHLTDDIGEERDVSAEYPDIVKRMEEFMKTARTPSVEFPFNRLDSLTLNK
ncbi:MAG: arylsulfatase [Bacteroidales bacterium]|nr:MAG: arylsulfatase [Bacteroidales bacterium]